MPRSTWKLHLNATSETSAQNILSRCVRAFGRPPVKSHLAKYAKGGYMVTLEIYHDDKLMWSEIIFEVLQLCQHLGSGWLLLGNIPEEYDAVLSKSESHIHIVGLNWAGVQVTNPKLH